MLLMQIERDALLKPLLAVTGIVDKRHTLPILSNVLIERTNQKIRCVASDLEVEVTRHLPLSVDGDDFRLAVSAAKLKDILSAMPEGSEVRFEELDGRLLLKAGKSRFNLQVMPAQDFPLVQLNEAPQVALELPQKELKRLLSQVQYAVAVQDIRYYLNGLLMQVDGQTLRLVATDGHRLALASIELSVSYPKTDIILPRKMIAELYKSLQDKDDVIHIEFLQHQVRFSLDDTVMISKVVDGKFPDYNRVIPLDNQNIVVLDRLAFLQVINRVSIVANEKFRGMRLLLNPNLLSVICANTEQEEAQDDLEVLYTGQTLDIGFNVDYIRDVLRHMPDETVQFALGDHSKSALFTIPDNPNFKYVVMPMRI